MNTYVTLIDTDKLEDKVATMKEKYHDECERNGNSHNKKLYEDFIHERCICFGFNYNELKEEYDFFGCISLTQIKESGSFEDAIVKEYGLDKKNIIIIGSESFHDWMVSVKNNKFK